MLLPLLLVAQLQAPASPVAREEYSGVARQTTVNTPRLDGRPVIDGILSESQWASAAVMRGFSQHNPLDGRPAEDSTTVLVWYGDDAMYFGIRAYGQAGSVHGTLADRDKIGNDDNVQVILDTFNDNRRAYVFAVNPLGVQADGVRSEGGFGRTSGNVGGSSTTSGGPGSSRLGISNVDLTQDMVWESKGRITDFGYEVEIRIPFKAVRFIPGRDTWGVNIVRTTVQSNFQDSWSPVVRAAASTLPQSGRLTGLHDMHRGLVLDVTPVATSLSSGAPTSSTNSAWKYSSKQEFGGDIRWGILPNVGINGTIRPDFSQVEADAGQLPGDVRFALFFPELRPFFVEGSENFDTPNQLVYTRNIVRPDAAVKLIGKAANTDFAVLSAIDGSAYGKSGKNPLVNIARVRRDLGSQSTLGLLFTDREDGPRFNRVANIDARYVFGGLYYASLQFAGTSTDTTGGSRFGRMWEATVDRTGRAFGFHYTFNAFSPEFATQTGFVSRTNIASISISNRFTWYGMRGAQLESVTSFLSLNPVWKYGDFFAGKSPLEAKASLSTTATVRGGWSFSLTPTVFSAQFDSAAYSRYYRVHPVGSRTDTVKFMPGDRVTIVQLGGRIQAPQFSKFGASVSATYGQDVEFLETARARRLDINASLDFRPTPQIRATTSMLHQEFVRDGGSTLLTTNIPRLRVEYQASRAVQFRFVGQYDSRMTDGYRDPNTGERIIFRSASGSYSSSSRTASNGMRADWLMAFTPSPGRVIYVGYGASLTEAEPFSFGSTTKRTSDGLFIKLSYQYRVQ